MSLHDRVVLTELFDKPEALTWLSVGEISEFGGDKARDGALFKVGDSEFVVWFYDRLMPDPYRGALVDVNFGVVERGGHGSEVDQGITGKMGRKSIKVISSVGATIMVYVKRRPRVKFLSLGADLKEPSRVSLYKKIAPKLVKKLGWAGIVEAPDIFFHTQILYKTDPPRRIKKKKKKRSAVFEAAVGAVVKRR